MQKHTIKSQHAHATVSKQVWARHSVTNSKPPRYEGGVAELMHTASAHGISRTVLPAVNGRIFVTMPMPFPVTGLPLHVNGSFMVQADRRKLWSGDGDKGRVSALCHFSSDVHHHTSGLAIAACSALHTLPMTLVSCCAARSSYDQNGHQANQERALTSIHAVQGALNEHILVTKVGPAWAALLPGICSTSDALDSFGHLSPQQPKGSTSALVYRYLWDHVLNAAVCCCTSLTFQHTHCCHWHHEV